MKIIKKIVIWLAKKVGVTANELPPTNPPGH
jgi:hypothetical protein